MNYRLYLIYKCTERTKRWFSSRFTDLGKLFLLVACVALFFGVDIQGTMIYQIFGAVLSILFFSFFLSIRFRVNLKIKRVLPETCVAGKEITYLIHVENQGKGGEKSIFYRERPEEPMPTWHDFNSLAEDGEEKRNLFDRKMGYYRWLWHVRSKHNVESCDQELPQLLPKQERDVEISLLPLKRGHIHLTGYVLTRIDPFGLCKHQIEYKCPENLLVLPKLYQVPKFFFQGSRKYHQGGLVAAQNSGDSGEFISLRDYNHGDPIKTIDWKSTARVGRPIVKQYRDEYFSRYGLILDSFVAKPHSQSFEEAVSVAASITMTLDSENSFLDLFFVGSECITCTVGRGLVEQQKMLEILASVSTCPDKSFAEITGLVKSHTALLSGMILVLIDLDEERKKLINYLVGNRIPVKIIVIVENREEYEAKKERIKIEVPLREIDINHMEEQLALL